MYLEANSTGEQTCFIFSIPFIFLQNTLEVSEENFIFSFVISCFSKNDPLWGGVGRGEDAHVF